MVLNSYVGDAAHPPASGSNDGKVKKFEGTANF